MPSRDVRPVVSRHRGGGYSGGGGSYYDDEGRGASKDLWEWFQEYFNSDPTLAHLLEMSDFHCYQCLTKSTYRYELMDIAFTWAPGWSAPGNDTRAHRLVLTKLSEQNWVEFHKHLLEGYNRHKEQMRREEHERAERYNAEYAAYMLRVEAERIEREEKDKQFAAGVIELTAGAIDTELAQVFTSYDRVGDYGEWIEDTVETYQDGSGFGTEIQKATGIKIQITLSLDLSNSMFYNGVNEAAAAAFRDLGLSLKALKLLYPNDLYVAFFTFSDDGWEGNGKRVMRLEVPDMPDPEKLFQGFESYRPSALADSWRARNMFSGTDTHLAPLFTQLEKWEKTHSDPGAVRLDLVLTDAVVEHKKDIAAADEIQERRDGSLQTIFMNFLKPEEAINSDLPMRCYQLFVDKDNVGGMLRQIISEFVTAHM